MGKSSVNPEMAKMQIDVAVIKEKISSFGATINSMNKALVGNGQPGILQNLNKNEDRLEDHLIKDTEWKGKKDGSISGIKWAIGLGFSLFGIVIGILAILI